MARQRKVIQPLGFFCFIMLLPMWPIIMIAIGEAETRKVTNRLLGV